MSDLNVDVSGVLVLGAGQFGMAVLRALAPRVRMVYRDQTDLRRWQDEN